MTTHAEYRSPVARVLAAHHSSISERDVADLLAKALEQASTDAPLSAAEESFFAQHAGLPLESPEAVRLRRGLHGLLQERAASSTSISTAEAAQLCGISESRMRHRIAAGEVYALPAHGRGRRLPLWQFTAGGALPHLGDVLAELPSEMPAAVLEAFMTEPAEDLQISGEPVSIATWLAAGGALTPVLELAVGENASR